MPFGILDTTYIDFPPGVDAAYIEGLRTAAGVDFADVVREIDSRLEALNTGIDPLLAMLLTTTTEVFADGIAPIAFEVQQSGEYTIARPQLVEGYAHMLPINPYDVTLGFTEDGLEQMSLKKILANVDSLFSGYRKLYRRLALQRLFSDAEVRVDAKTTAKSPGFAGSGTGDNAFTRPYPDGSALPGGYTHYYRVASASLATGIKTARDRLRKWHKGPFDLIAPQAMIDLITAINPGSASDGFVSAGTLLVRNSANSAEAQVDGTIYLGVLFGDIRVHMAIDDFTDANIAIFKSYGNFNPENPLVWRYDELAGRNAYVRTRSLFPLADAVLKQKLGIGVNNRVGATLIRVDAAGNYVAPTNWS